MDLSDHSVSETAEANKPKHCRELSPSTVVVITTRKGGWMDEWWTSVFEKCYCEYSDGFFKTCKGLLLIDSIQVHITIKHSSHSTLLWTGVLRPSSPVGDVDGGWGAQFHNNMDDGSCNFLGCHEMDWPSMDFRHNWNHSVWIPKDQTAHLNWCRWWVWGQPSRALHLPPTLVELFSDTQDEEFNRFHDVKWGWELCGWLGHIKIFNQCSLGKC